MTSSVSSLHDLIDLASLVPRLSPSFISPRVEEPGYEIDQIIQSGR